MKINILYEDKDILVIDKPSGISVHSDGRSKEKTISDWFIKKYPKSKNVGENLESNGKVIKKPGIVHRLDKETSGVLLLVKSEKAYTYYKDLFKNRKIKKTYVAIVEGLFKNNSGVIKEPIGRSPRDFRRKLAGRGARGEMREAITEYKVLSSCEIFSLCALPRSKDRVGTLADKKFHKTPVKVSLVEINPKTGRTHQIRVHMKYVNHPIVCDNLYNPKGVCPANLGRLALHAKSLEFENQKGVKIKVESKIPEEFEKLQK